MEYIISTSNLTKSYGKGEATVHALRKTTIGFEMGKFTAIMGPSGSGKSTLLHLLGGLDTPTSGAVYFNNSNIYDLNDDKISELRRRSFGFVFQSFNLIPILTVKENILLPILLDHAICDEAYVNDMIRLLGLEKRLHHLPGAISGGQQQRVALARALVNKPSIIFADEPTGNLDTKTGMEVLKLLRCIQKKYNQTLIMVTHDEAISKQADRIITIADGVVVADKKGERS